MLEKIDKVSKINGRHASREAFGKTFVVTALNKKAHDAIHAILKEPQTPEEAELVKISLAYHDPTTLQVYVTSEEFIKRITEVSEQTKNKLPGRIRNRYNVNMQIEELKRRMTIREVVSAIMRGMEKHGANFYDYDLEVMTNGRRR